MKWLFLVSALSIGFISPAHAQINQLPNATLPLSGDEFIAIDQAQGDNFKTSKVAIGSIGQVSPHLPTTIINTTTILPAGTAGTILVQCPAACSMTLPPTPVVGQVITIKDGNGTASALPITIVVSGSLIEGLNQLVIQTGYGWANLTFNGSQWVQI